MADGLTDFFRCNVCALFCVFYYIFQRVPMHPRHLLSPTPTLDIQIWQSCFCDASAMPAQTSTVLTSTPHLPGRSFSSPCPTHKPTNFLTTEPTLQEPAPACSSTVLCSCKLYRNVFDGERRATLDTQTQTSQSKLPTHITAMCFCK